MKIKGKIVESLYPPQNKQDMWIDNGVLKYYHEGTWKAIKPETSSEETDDLESIKTIVSKIITTGNGTKYLSDNGTYKTITVPTKLSELTNDSGYTKNTGTITGIKMNGASKGTSGVIDLGTVITAHQSLTGYAKTSDITALQSTITALQTKVTELEERVAALETTE